MDSILRHILNFLCEDESCAATLDTASGETGLLIVSGGNEIRVGAHGGMARLAGHLALRGIPTFRFDRRGVGDSSGENDGYTASAADIAAAATAFRAACPHVTRLIGLGNCDAATALALFHDEARLDALILTNPWAVESDSALPPPGAIRRHYARRLRDPAAWRAFRRGGIDLGKLAQGLSRAARPAPPQPLAMQLAAALADTPPARIILAERDMTAMAFADQWRKPLFAAARARIDVATIPTASHGFAGHGDEDRLFAIILEAIGELSAWESPPID